MKNLILLTLFSSVAIAQEAKTIGNRASGQPFVIDNNGGDTIIEDPATFSSGLSGDGSGLTGFTAGQIPSLDASKITTGSFAAGQIPSLDASKITTGSFADGRIAASNVTQHQGSISISPGQLSSVVAVSQGGTGANNTTTARSNLGANNASNLTTGTLPSGRLSGTYGISVTGSAGSVPATGVSGSYSASRIVAKSSLATGEGLGLNSAINGVSFYSSGSFKNGGGQQCGYIAMRTAGGFDRYLWIDINGNLRLGANTGDICAIAGVQVN